MATLRTRCTRPPLPALPALTPLSAALAAACAAGLGAGADPGWAQAAPRAALPALPRPTPATVPVPAASWRVDGTGATAPVNRPNAQGGVDQTIGQTSRRAIYHWNSFDIGAKSSVTFDMAQDGSAALNRVTGSTAPSRIFGRLSATRGGEIYLINGNGILFGRGAQVRDVGALVASTLNLTDDEFRSGLVNSLTNGTPAFRYDGVPADWVDERNFVRVDAGAQIETVDGGRILLFAKRVENAGTLASPGGQVVLGGGAEAYLNLPTNESALYGADGSGDVPVLRGLLVEMGNGPSDGPGGAAQAGGSVDNRASGTILTPRGNTTLVGLAVNHSGRISATTSVSENGSVFLRAQGGPVVVDTVNATRRASQAGALTLGEGAVIEILPDTSNEDAGQAAATSDDNTTFVASRIDLAGASVDLGRDAQVVAPGGALNIWAETTPRYERVASAASPYVGGQDSARIVLGEGVRLDVSGTTDTLLSVQRHYVTTDLLGSNDLRDAPVQKDGLLFRSRVTVDSRGTSPILGDLQGLRNGLQRTVGERLSAGGSVNLVAQGGVVMFDTATIDVSGGQVAYTGATVAPTRVQAADGSLYDLNTAPVDGVYTRAYNLQRTSDAEYDRWGVKVNYGAVLPGVFEAGYVDGRGAGSVSVVAPVVVLSGTLKADTVMGERQRQGRDALATGGQLSVGANTNAGAFGQSSYQGAVLGTAVLGDGVNGLDAALRAAPMTAALPSTSWLSLDRLLGDEDGQHSGFADLRVAAEGDVLLQTDRTVQGPANGQLQLLSVQGEARLDASVRAASADVTLRSLAGAAVLADGREVDLSGQWLNQRLDGPLATGTAQGGTFTLSGAQAVLGAGSQVDVSGGALVSTSGSVTGADAGSISLTGRVAGTSLTEPGPDPATAVTTPAVQIGGSLHAHSLAQGGSLSISAPDVQIGTVSTAEGAPAPLAGAERAPVVLNAQTFTQGGFSRYAVTGVNSLEVAAGTAIAPRRDTFLPPGLTARDVATGADTAAVLGIGRDPLSLVPAVNLTLASPGTVISDRQVGGDLRVGAGARVDAVAESQVSLSAGRSLQFDGEIRAPGGAVSLRTTIGGNAFDQASWLWLGEDSRIDVAGTTLFTTDAAGLRSGRVLNGGTVNLAVDSASRAGSLVMRRGAEIDARGTAGVLDVSLSDGASLRTERRALASSGGSLTVRANRDLQLDGTLLAQGGQAEGEAAPGGSLSVTLAAVQADAESVETPDGPVTPAPDFRILRITEQRTGGSAALDPATLGTPLQLEGRATVSADFVRDSGVADFSATARDRIAFIDSVDLALDRTLSLSARLVSTPTGADVTLSAPQVVLGSTVFSQYTPEESLVGRPFPVATTGEGSLSVQADNLVLQGRLVTQGMDTVTLRAQQEVQLRSDNQDLALNAADRRAAGSLSVRGDLTIQAAQIYPATNTAFTLDSGPGALRIEGQGLVPDTPLSAGGSLTLRGQTVTQGGVVRAPQGRIEIDAPGGVTLTVGSLTSVSGAGTVVPYGVFTDDDTWRAPLTGGGTGAGTPLTQAPQKDIVLSSDRGSVDVQAGATLDLSGGGTVQATQFVPGPGGSTDVFTGADGSFAILPGFDGLAAHDPLLADAAARIGRQIVIGPGAPVPAGRYTLLPARYALLPGGVLVRPQTSGSPRLDSGVAVAQTDGSVLIGARLADAGTAFADALPSTWRLTPREVGLRRSEIRTADAQTFFPALAERRSLPAARLPGDAGSLTIAADTAQIDGRGVFDTAEGGQGGELQFAADRIRVTDRTDTAIAGELSLRADALNAFGAQTVILGGVRLDGTDALDVQATQVVLAQQNDALRVPDLVAIARDEVRVEAGAQVLVTGRTGEAAEPTDYTLRGDGAALRVAANPGAALAREGARRDGGVLQVGTGATLAANTGTVLLDATSRTVLEAGSRIRAADVTVTAARIAVGPAQAADPQTLALGGGLLAQLSQADALTLRSYSSIDFGWRAQLGSEALEHLTLDAPRLRVNREDGRASVEAGTVVLANTVGADPVNGLLGGGGRLELQATTAGGGAGELVLAGGEKSVRAAEVVAQADTAVRLQGGGGLSAGGDLTLRTPLIDALDAGADQSLAAAGAMRLEAAPGSSTASASVASADGARLQLQAARMTVSTDIVLPTGQLIVQATGAQAGDALHLQAGARLDTAGRLRDVAGTAVAQAGGDIVLSSASGDVRLDAGTSLDVSAAGTAMGGSVELSATRGAVRLDGKLRGYTDARATGAQLSVDSAQALDLATLADRLAPAADGRLNFGDRLDLRTREGDQQLDAGLTLAAREIVLQADAGALQIEGTLDASGHAGRAAGGRIALAAGGDLTVAGGARLDVSAQTGSGAAGGRIALHSDEGTMAVRSGSTLDLRGEAAESGSVLQLRARRTGLDGGPTPSDTSAGTDVAVAAIGGQVLGARRLEVEAVKVYDGIHTVIDRERFFGLPAGDNELDVTRLERESTAFLTGQDGRQAERVAQRLAGGQDSLREALVIHAGAEVRSDGDLRVDAINWALPAQSLGDAADAGPVGDTSVTLRAAGDLQVPYSLSAGYGSFFGSPRFEMPRSTEGGSLRLVAGADLSAAGVTRTRTDGQGDLLVGRPPEFGAATTTVLATTTGDLELAAAGRVDLSQGKTRVYSMGRGSQDAQALALEAQLRAAPELAALLPPAQSVGVDENFQAVFETPSIFRVDGGDVRISAGTTVTGRQSLVEFGQGTIATINDWRAMGSVAASADGRTPAVSAWWTKLGFLPYEIGNGGGSFDFGLASFAGGEVDVRSGGGVNNLYAVAAGSGHVQGSGAEAQLTRFSAGDLRVRAAADIVNGVYVGGGASLSLRAGGSMKRVEGADLTVAGTGTRVLLENTRGEVQVRGDLTLHSVRSAFGAGRGWFSGLDGEAELAARTAGGDLQYLGADEPVLTFDAVLPAQAIVPGNFTLAAPNGALSLSGALTQQPVDDGRLNLLARDDVTVNATIKVQATRASDLGPELLIDSPALGALPATAAVQAQAYADRGVRLDRSERDAVRIASAEGDIAFLNDVAFDSARPVSLEAGRDLLFGRSALQVQQQSQRWDADTGRYVEAAEFSLLRAGRDLGTSSSGSLTVAGGGEVLLLAGRQIELGTGLGVRSVGNSVNLNLNAIPGTPSVLPEGGASITLVAGLRADGVDYARAVSQGFQALGGLGLADRAGDVYAQLRSPGTPAALDSAEARAFNALSADAQRAQVRQLLGAAAYDQALADYVRGLPGKASLSATQAVAAFAGLSADEKAPAAGVVLAAAFGTQPSALRSAFIGQLAAASQDTSRLAALQAHLLALGVRTEGAAQAVAAFEALPLSQQVPLLNRLLVQDLRESGRKAVATSGADAQAAYARGYRALNLLFPVQPPDADTARPAGDIRSASSQVKTLQGGDITLFAPGGSVNAGGVSAITDKSANELGIVTVAGGDIAAVVGQDFLVNQSRVFTLAEGDILMWASQGDIDAGRGAKTVVGSPAPVLRLDNNGRLFLDVSGSFTGSGIAVLDAGSALDLYAPAGAIDAGEAGIRARGNAFFGAQTVRGADNLQVGGVAAGAPPAPPAVANVGAVGNSAQDSAARSATERQDEEDERRQRRARRQLLLEFLGFGSRG